MLNSALNVGRLLATYRSWTPARDLSEFDVLRLLTTLNYQRPERNAMGRNFSDHRTDASEQRQRRLRRWGPALTSGTSSPRAVAKSI